MLATCGALGMAFIRLHQRNSNGYQRWLRGRVLAQGFTVLAIVVAGVQEFGDVRAQAKEIKKVREEALAEQKAFERRMKEAEEAHNVEQRLGAGTAPSPTPKPAPAPMPVGSNSTTSSSTSTPGESRENDREKSNGGNSSAPKSSWSSWLGLSKS